MASPYLKAALLTVALALFGFLIINQLDAMRASEIRASVDDLVIETEAERLMLLYAQTMGNSTSELCNYLETSSESKASRTYVLSEKIKFYERSSMQSEEYERIKSQYYLANAQLYLNLRAAEKYCGSSKYDTVLFFYKVYEDCPECRAQGGVLDNLRAKYPALRVFSFPMDTNRPYVNIFAKRHGITEAPTLVINDAAVLRGAQSEGQVEKYLAKPNSQGS